MNAFAVVPVETYGSLHIAKVENLDHIRLENITDTPADKYVISNSSVFISNFSDWQNWDANVEFTTDVKLYINDIDTVSNGVKVEKHLFARCNNERSERFIQDKFYLCV